MFCFEGLILIYFESSLLHSIAMYTRSIFVLFDSLLYDICAVFIHVPNVYLHKDDINRHLLLSINTLKCFLVSKWNNRKQKMPFWTVDLHAV